VLPPAANGTAILTGRCGHLSAAIALSEDAASAPTANDFRTILRVVISVTPASLVTGQIIVHDALACFIS
jgi:hypothetical protein